MLIREVGIAGNTGLGRGGFGAVGGRIAERIVEILMNLLNTVEDAAKTRTYMKKSCHPTRRVARHVSGVCARQQLPKHVF